MTERTDTESAERMRAHFDEMSEEDQAHEVGRWLAINLTRLEQAGVNADAMTLAVLSTAVGRMAAQGDNARAAEWLYRIGDEFAANPAAGCAGSA